MRRAPAAALVLGLVLALAGCGPGGSAQPSDLTVTRDFGAASLPAGDAPKAVAGDWFAYVNGVAVTHAPASKSGARIWWDRHAATATRRVPAVVGSFPEPFRHGIDGKRLPVRIECAAPGSAPCKQVSQTLASFGVPAALGGLLTSHVEETLRVLVGPWSALSADHAIDELAQGPSASGVYVRITGDGRSIVALDADGRPVRTLAAGAGLIAATARPDARPTWVVTGTDDAGVAAAARAFDERTLMHRFAIAVSDGRPLALPMG